VSSAQVWTVIGGFLAILVAMIGLVLALVRAEVEGLRRELLARFDGLERDVHRLYVRAFEREEPPAP